MEEKGVSILIQPDVKIGTALKIIHNFPASKAAMIEGLKEYEIEVTSENLPSAKKMATELNQLSIVIGKLKKEKAKEAGIPIEEFKALAKELEDLAQDARQKLLAKIDVFDNETRKICKVLMVAHLSSEYDRLEVRKEYRTGEPMIDPMVGISCVTSKGFLTKGARESIEGLAQQGRIAQDRVDGRINQLKAECAAAGLETPLDPSYIERWVNESDAVYQDNLRRLIGIELDRQVKAKAAVIAREQDRIRAEERVKAESEAKIRADAERVEREARDVLARTEAIEKAHLAKVERDRVDAENKAKVAEASKVIKESFQYPRASDPPPPVVPASMRASVSPDKPTRTLRVITCEIQVMAKTENDNEKVKKWFREAILPGFRDEEIKKIEVK